METFNVKIENVQESKVKDILAAVALLNGNIKVEPNPSDMVILSSTGPCKCCEDTEVSGEDIECEKSVFLKTLEEIIPQDYENSVNIKLKLPKLEKALMCSKKLIDNNDIVDKIHKSIRKSVDHQIIKFLQEELKDPYSIGSYEPSKEKCNITPLTTEERKKYWDNAVIDSDEISIGDNLFVGLIEDTVCKYKKL